MDKAYEYWLHQVPGIGDRSLLRMLQFFESAQEIYQRACKRDEGVGEFLQARQRAALYRSAAEWDVMEEYERLQKKAIRFLTCSDREYPLRLKEIPDPPYGIYVKGRLPDESSLSVAVIGARECSEYGRYVAEVLGQELGENGIQVISGMARGIDGISQAAALKAGGFSVGVLGCGVDICYPAENRRLYEWLEHSGGLLSAYAPGTEPKPGNFPPRNRIVSGLADVLVVVEARQKSGTLITVDMALEQGREVYVVPGRITDRLSDGCHRLLRQGAGVVTSPREFIGEIKELFPGKSVSLKMRENSTAEQDGMLQAKGGDLKEEKEEVQRLWGCLDLSPKAVEQLCMEAGTKMTYPEVKRLLTQKVLSGEVVQPAPGFYALSGHSQFHSRRFED